ncbi:thiamine ABC transporter ATP-binding protein [Nitratireductor luteus]|uniref:thiamine ABC transporter ATP-binding protein n=1 Tax=Nitratireductor luteus TaxID=2976980 RepID=UPI002240E2DC|nr:thiamine ABC transporter ATP-binding protein [Nitratireductor luteus]
MKTDATSRYGASIRLDRTSFTYPGGTAMLFDLQIESSDIVAVMGPSGSGKSTLLNLVAGFERPDAGRILIGGQDVTDLAPARRPVSMVFQENNLFAHLTVEQNVGLGRSPRLRLSEQDRTDIAAALERTGLVGKERRLPHALSGGERQRVALARVLVRDRPVLLLDEPFASLGPALRDGMLDLMKELHRDHAMTILMATHDPRDAARLTETMIVVDGGRIAGIGSTSDFLSGNGPEAFDLYLGAQGRKE